jgi:hypothetical protein
MTLFALKSLIAIALWETTQSVAQDTLGRERCRDSVSLTTVKNSLRLNLNSSTVGYISSLPLQLAALCSAPDAAGMPVADMAQTLMERWHPGPTDQTLEGLIGGSTEMHRLPSGQLQLNLQFPGLMLWLEHWNQLTEEPFGAVEALPSALNAAFSGRNSLAQTLQLDPLVVMHYIYARCDRLCQMKMSGQHGPALQSQRIGGNALGGQTLKQPLTVLRALIHLADHLAEVDAPLARLLTLGYRLAETTDSWLSNLACLSALMSWQWALLAGVRRALYILLGLKCGCALPQSL